MDSAFCQHFVFSNAGSSLIGSSPMPSRSIVSMAPLAPSQVAGRKHISILDAAAEMKQSKDATEFRRWLSAVQRCLADDSLSSKLEALRLLDELKRAASSWASQFDVAENVTHKRRKLRLSWVPRIGALLSVLELPTVRDP